MIIDRLENINAYGNLGEHFRTAASWLTGRDLSTLPLGSITIDGRNVFANLADNLLSRETPAYEAHHLYADIQLIVDGQERFFLGIAGRIGDPEPDSDFYPCEADSGISFDLARGWFVIFLPGEMHAPGNPCGIPSVCRKLVIKVLCGDSAR
ncbi:MAG: YhcH/YjgK/YiaL family protein [Clostridia bacterium]|nr:YhcH/YjgK/YiaL family protein [Clostridia bacterium]MBQ9288951.1 YhcH/YjgK/YiaL family protein [Clostridia bacterium]